MSLEEVSFEESIKTEDEVGSITSTIGIKRKNDNGWTPLPVPAVEPEPIQLPQFEAPDINWGYVAAGVAVGVIIAGAIVLAATQNVLKYTQTHREIEALADTSYCFDVYALAIVNNTLLTSSCTLHSRKFLR